MPCCGGGQRHLRQRRGDVQGPGPPTRSSPDTSRWGSSRRSASGPRSAGASPGRPGRAGGHRALPVLPAVPDRPVPVLPNRTIGHGVTPLKVATGTVGRAGRVPLPVARAILHPIDKTLPAELAVMFNPIGAGVRWACHLGGVGLGDTVLVLGGTARAGRGDRGPGRRGGHHRHRAGHRRAQAGAGPRVRRRPHDRRRRHRNTVARVTELTDGELADVTLELTPMAAAPVTDAMLATRHGGRVVLAGLKGGRRCPCDRSDHQPGAHRGRRVRRRRPRLRRGHPDHRVAPVPAGEAAHPHVRPRRHGLAMETLAGEVAGEAAVHVSVHPGAM